MSHQTLETQAPGEVYVAHEIHMFARGGTDPKTQEELGDRAIIKYKWDDELEAAAATNAKTKLSCVRVVIDPTKPYFEQRTVTHNLMLVPNECRNWCAMGLEAPELNVAPMVESIMAPINAKVVNITQSDNPEVTKLLETATAALSASAAKIEAMEAKIAELESAKETTKKVPPKKKVGGD